MSGVFIEYGNIAPEAKENFFPKATEKESFVELSNLQKYDLSFPNFGNPCELYQTLLDGTAKVIPSLTEPEDFGWWSIQTSDEQGQFETPITLILEAEQKYSSQGITLTFDTNNGIFSNDLNIKWYRDEELISSKDFFPDTPLYFCDNLVQFYNNVEITFYKMNMPYNRLKLNAIDYGNILKFTPKEIRGVKLIQELNPISTEISINTADFTLDIDPKTGILPQKKQPITVYFNEGIQATTFIDDSKRISKNIWKIQSEDYIGLLDSIPYYGGMYYNENAVSILEDIFSVAKVPYSIEAVFNDINVSGYIPYTTCREALMQVCFAIQAVADTSCSDVVKIYSLPSVVSQKIPLNRIMQGATFENTDTVTSIEIASHAYIPTDETMVVYSQNIHGMGENIFVKFPEPLYDLSIKSEIDDAEGNGEILAYGVNYAIINAYDNDILVGKRFKHEKIIKRKNNPNVLSTQQEKIIAIENATLVTTENIDKVIEKCYNYLTITNTANVKIVEGKHVSGGNVVRYGQAKYGSVKYGEILPKITTYDKAVNVGNMIIMETEFLGDLQGTIIKETFNLNGGIVIKNCTIK